jgi:hypothetical protein
MQTIYLVKETIDYDSDTETPVYVEAYKDDEVVNATYLAYSHEGYNANTNYWYKVEVFRAILK